MAGGSINIISGSALFPDITDNAGVLVTIGVPTLIPHPVAVGNAVASVSTSNGLEVSQTFASLADFSLAIKSALNLTVPSGAAGFNAAGLQMSVLVDAGSAADYAQLYGAYIYAEHDGSGDVTDLVGQYISTYAYASAGAIEDLFGLVVDVYADNASQITNSYGVYSKLFAIDSDVDVVNSFTLYAAAPNKTNSPVLTNAYGLFIGDHSAFGGTISRNIHSAGAASQNYLEGITQIGANIRPIASDGAALGTTTLMWSDLFLASGGVINWNNGDVTLTHASDLLTMAGGDLLLNRSSATAFEVGPNGTTSPTLIVVTNTASGATGLSITNAASGSGVTLRALGGTNEAFNIAAKGSGEVRLTSNGSAAAYSWTLEDTGANAYGRFLTTSGQGGFGIDGDALYFQAEDSLANGIKFWPTSTSATQTLWIRPSYTVSIGRGSADGYVLNISPTIGVAAAGQTVFIQDATATTGKTTCVFQGGAVAGNIIEIRNAATTLNGSITDAGVCDMVSYKAGGTAGATAGPFTAVTSIQVKGGIVTVLTGT